MTVFIVGHTPIGLNVLSVVHAAMLNLYLSLQQNKFECQAWSKNIQIGEDEGRG